MKMPYNVVGVVKNNIYTCVSQNNSAKSPYCEQYYKTP